MSNESNAFAVYGEVEGYPKPLLMIRVSFGRLIDEIVLPYETGKTFFLDGVSVSKLKLRRLKILKLNAGFEFEFSQLNRAMNHHSSEQMRRIHGEQYDTRIDAIIRNNSDDVTAQIVSAYEMTIGQKLKEYLPKRDELINAASQVFSAALSQLAKHG